MEKVKLTKEQAEAIENTESRYGKDLTVIRHAERYFHDEDECNLIELTTAEVAKALYIGYEVEETFEVGDWVVQEDVAKTGRDIITKITSIEDGCKLYGSWQYIDGGESTHFRNAFSYAESCRHATPEEIAEEKQRRWWARHGREVWELRKGDVISDDDGEFHEVSNNNENEDGVSTMSGGFNQTYLEKYSKVICFAEDRKDNA